MELVGHESMLDELSVTLTLFVLKLSGFFLLDLLIIVECKVYADGTTFVLSLDFKLDSSYD